MLDKHVAKIVKAYDDATDIDKYMRIVEVAEIAENDYNLNIPLYVEKIIEDNLPSVEEALTDLKSAWSESLQAEEKFKTILKEFLA